MYLLVFPCPFLMIITNEYQVHHLNYFSYEIYICVAKEEVSEISRLNLDFHHNQKYVFLVEKLTIYC